MALLDGASGREASSARLKLAKAIQVAEHVCPPTGGCPVCRSSPAIKQRRKEDFKRSIANANKLAVRLSRETAASARREAMLNPPNLKLTGSSE